MPSLPKKKIAKIIIPESVIEEEILWRLYKLGIFAFKCPTTGFYDTKRKAFRKHTNPFCINGVSDVIAIINGKFIAIECKSATGRTTPDQIKFIDNVNKNGGIAFVAKSWQEVKDKLAL
jgi:penicillin-binding protein-related factor A (putative recombinase)